SVRASQARWSICRQDVPRFVVVGVCAYTLYQLGFVLGLDRTSPFSSSLLISTVPLFTIVLLTLIGDLLSLGSAISFAVYGVVNRPLVRRYPTATYTAYTVLAGAVPLIIVTLPSAVAQNWASVSLGTWVVVAYMIALPVYVAYIVWNWATSRRG